LSVKVQPFRFYAPIRIAVKTCRLAGWFFDDQHSSSRFSGFVIWQRPHSTVLSGLTSPQTVQQTAPPADAAKVGTVDMYNGSTTNGILAINDLALSGDHVLRFVLNGKNGSSGGYVARISGITLIKE